MHLHPGWQQTVVASLREAFPAMQIIVTTHSPQVLTTVSAEHIRMISNDGPHGQVDQPAVSPLARPSNDALAFVLHTDPRPPLALKDDLHRFEQLVRKGQEESEEAQEVRGTIEKAGVQIPESDLALWRFFAKRRASGK